jgi:PAS domain S-box-containing protein
MHSLLKRQIKKIFGEIPNFGKELTDFISAVDSSYKEFDTDREMLERSLELSSQELVQANTDMNNILVAIPDLIFRLDQQGFILDLKASSRDDFIITPTELYGKRIQDIPIKELSVKFQKAIQEVNNSKSIVNIEYDLTVNGNVEHYETRLIPLINDQMIAIIRNITVRKNTEEALKESEERYRTFIDSIPNFIFLKDNQLRYINVNDALVEFMGKKSKDEILGKKDEDLLTKELAEQCRKGDLEVLRSLEISIYEERSNNQFLETIKFPVRLSNNRIGIGGFVSDITTRKLAQEEILKAKEHAEEINRLKSNFLSNLSHELRTPLVGLLGFSDILFSTLEGENKRYSEMIYKSGQRLLNTLNSTLSYTKIETGKIEIIENSVSVIHLLNEEVKLYQPLAIQKGLYLEEEIYCDDYFVLTDERMVREVIGNLINNAVKFTFEGGITVSLNLEENKYLIKISDTGVGIPKDKYDVIFEEFRQVSEGQSRNFEGAGLGLTIANKYIERLGGDITFKSQIGVGTTFYVKLPVKDSVKNIADHYSGVQQSPLKKESELQIKSTRVLLVEDDEMNLLAIKNMIESLCIVISVSSAKAAIEEVKRSRIDLILMDINLRHGMTGIEATKVIRKIDGYDCTPIVAMTAYVMPNDREEFLAAGCSHYLAKPFERKELLALLDECEKRSINAKTLP